VAARREVAPAVQLLVADAEGQTPAAAGLQSLEEVELPEAHKPAEGAWVLPPEELGVRQQASQLLVEEEWLSPLEVPARQRPAACPGLRSWGNHCKTAELLYRISDRSR
jgi:hypothetical protein